MRARMMKGKDDEGLRMMKMTMRLKSSATAADGVFTDIVWKPLNRDAFCNVLLKRTSIPMGAHERFVAQERSLERLAEMSLGALLYYALVGEGKIADEPA